VSAPSTVDGLYSLGGILTVEKGRHMICRLDDERAKAKRLLKRLKEKEKKVLLLEGTKAHKSKDSEEDDDEVD